MKKLMSVLFVVTAVCESACRLMEAYERYVSIKSTEKSKNKIGFNLKAGRVP